MGRGNQLWDVSPEVITQRQRAVEMDVAGLTEREIARELGISTETAHRAIKNGLRMLVGDRTIETERQRDKVRLEQMIRALYPQALRGDVEAVREIRELTKRRSQLLGLDAPRRLDVRQEVTVVHVDAFDAEIAALNAELGAAVALGTGGDAIRAIEAGSTEVVAAGQAGT